jgi:hypothetical protein
MNPQKHARINSRAYRPPLNHICWVQARRATETSQIGIISQLGNEGDVNRLAGKAKHTAKPIAMMQRLNGDPQKTT